MKKTNSLPIAMPEKKRGLIVDLFAGGGGASTGIFQALGVHPDIAINHNPAALGMHRANHPVTTHFAEDVWTVSPSWVTKGHPVSLLWASPDCTHHSKAKGGVPIRDDKRRSLACVITEKWIPEVRPEVIIMENVEEFKSWGPLTQEGLIIQAAKGDTFRWFLNRLKKFGYRVEYKELRACDYGAPTIRKRLFLIAKRNNAKIVWPEPTHGDGRGLLPFRSAAECIDWSIPCPSIFERKRPLVDATMKRIAKGLIRYVLTDPKPFIMTYYGTKKEEFRGACLTEPLRTQTTENRHALIMPFLAKYYGGVVGSPVTAPMGTVTSVDHHWLVAAYLMRQFGKSIGSDMAHPMGTITAGGGGKTGLVTAFLLKYYGSDQDPRLNEPLHTITTKGRFDLVTVQIEGELYYIADIGLRMLQPKELFRAQGFPDDYIITHGVDQQNIAFLLTKTQQIQMCGNSVSPLPAAALVRSNVDCTQFSTALGF